MSPMTMRQQRLALSGAFSIPNTRSQKSHRAREKEIRAQVQFNVVFYS